MADPKAKRHVHLKQTKFPVYQALYSVNQAFQNIALELEHLDDYAVFTLPLFRLFMFTLEETRAGINQRVTEYLNTHESEAWAHHGKQRRALEDRLKS